MEPEPVKNLKGADKNKLFNIIVELTNTISQQLEIEKQQQLQTTKTTTITTNGITITTTKTNGITITTTTNTK